MATGGVGAGEGASRADHSGALGRALTAPVKRCGKEMVDGA